MWSDIIFENSGESTWPLFLTDLLLKLTIVLAAGAFAVCLMRRHSAATKHFVWMVSLISCLFVPAAMLLLPGWGIERAVNREPVAVGPAPAIPLSATTAERARQLPPTESHGRLLEQSTAHAAPADRARPLHLELASGVSGDRITANELVIWLLTLWLAGVVFVLLPLLLGIGRVALLYRRSASVSGKSWARLTADIARSLQLNSGFTLLRSRAIDVPLCGGIVRPFVILPGECRRWTPERRRLVLLHELAHARRGDVLVQWICRIVCAVYWFHPLVWFVARRMKAEQERACDDLVLTVGTTPASVYAELLVAIAADCRNAHRHSAAAAAFIRHGELESRIRCILQSDRPRTPLSASYRTVLLLLILAAMVSVATAGRVIIRDREGNVVATMPVPAGGTVTIEEQTQEEGEEQAEQTEEPDLWKQIDTAIEASRERYLMADRHTPWQIIRLFVPFGREHTVRLNGSLVNTLEFVSGGPVYDGQSWFQKTPHGGRAHPFTIPYAFEGHPHQFVAWLSTADLPLEHEFQTPDGPITIAEMVEHVQATVNERQETTWTLWFLTKYLSQDAKWANEHGHAWSMEKLVRIQVDATVSRAPVGGIPQQYALTLARNARHEQTGQLDGVWQEADTKIRRHLDLARRRQEFDGSFSQPVLYGRRRMRVDWMDRVGTTGAVLAWVCIALPPEELDADWVSNAAQFVAMELEQNRREPMDVDDLADALHGLVAYRQHRLLESE